VGHLALAVRCRVPIVTSICIFDGSGRFKFVHNGPHYPNPDLDHEAAMNELQEKCLRDMEYYIQEYPEQWFHFLPLGDKAA
jgi:lauroyl/myristoyl acyltransferase